MKRTGLHQVNLQLQIIDSYNKHHELNLTLSLDSLCFGAFQLTLSISPTTLPCAQAAALPFGSYLKFLLVHLLQAYSFTTSIFIHYKHTSLSIVIKVALKSLSANFNIWIMLGLVSVWVNSRSWWWTGRPGVLRFMGSQRVGHDWVTEPNWGLVSTAYLLRMSLIFFFLHGNVGFHSPSMIPCRGSMGFWALFSTVASL